MWASRTIQIDRLRVADRHIEGSNRGLSGLVWNMPAVDGLRYRRLQRLAWGVLGTLSHSMIP